MFSPLDGLTPGGLGSELAFACIAIAAASGFCAVVWTQQQTRRHAALNAALEERWGPDAIATIVASKDEIAAARLRTAAERAREIGVSSGTYIDGVVDGPEAFELAVAADAWERIRHAARNSAALTDWLAGPFPASA